MDDGVLVFVTVVAVWVVGVHHGSISCKKWFDVFGCLSLLLFVVGVWFGVCDGGTYRIPLLRMEVSEVI